MFSSLFSYFKSAVKHECNGSDISAQEQAMQLEKIFEENPMARYDPEQLQEFLNVKKIKKRKNVPQF